MRLFLVLSLATSLGIFLAPTGVPVLVFSQANASKVPHTLRVAARGARLDLYAVRLAIAEHVEPRGPGMPHLVSLLTHLRGRVLSGRDQMAAYALERAYVGQGIIGWEDAATRCFSKPDRSKPDRSKAEGPQPKGALTLSDAATLLVHMRSPTRFYGNRSGDLLDHRNALLQKMAENGAIPRKDAAAASLHPLTYCADKILHWLSASIPVAMAGLSPNA